MVTAVGCEAGARSDRDIASESITVYTSDNFGGTPSPRAACGIPATGSGSAFNEMEGG